MTTARLRRHASRLAGRAASMGPEGLGKRVGWASVVEVLQLVSSMLVFFVLARLLSETDMGIMGAVLGIAIPVASLSGLGSHVLLIKRVAQGQSIETVWPRATSVGILGPAVGTVLIIAARPLVAPDIDAWVFVLFIVSQVNLFWLTELAVYVGNGSRQIREAAQLRALVIACRLVALGAFVLFGDGRLIVWAVASVASFAAGAAISFVFVRRVFGARASLRRASMADVREGWPFAANSGSESLVDASDKPMLVYYGHSDDAGIYTLGTRIIQFGYLPLRILLRASDADLFEAGKRGTAAALRVTRSLLLPAALVGAGVGLGFLVLAPLVPIVAGDKWTDAVTTIRFLAVLPLIRGVQYLMGNCLSAAEHQGWRVRATLAAAALNFTLNLWLLPNGTWRTAVFTTIVSEIFLTAVLIVTVYAWVWKEGPDHEVIHDTGR